MTLATPKRARRTSPRSRRPPRLLTPRRGEELVAPEGSRESPSEPRTAPHELAEIVKAKELPTEGSSTVPGVPFCAQVTTAGPRQSRDGTRCRRPCWRGFSGCRVGSAGLARHRGPAGPRDRDGVPAGCRLPGPRGRTGSCRVRATHRPHATVVVGALHAPGSSLRELAAGAGGPFLAPTRVARTRSLLRASRMLQCGMRLARQFGVLDMAAGHEKQLAR
jgi:hypothetical protein